MMTFEEVCTVNFVKATVETRLPTRRARTPLAKAYSDKGIRRMVLALPLQHLAKHQI